MIINIIGVYLNYLSIKFNGFLCLKWISVCNIMGDIKLLFINKKYILNSKA